MTERRLKPYPLSRRERAIAERCAEKAQRKAQHIEREISLHQVRSTLTPERIGAAVDTAIEGESR